MNRVKKILVDYKKPRSIYDKLNKVYNQKWNPSNIKEEMRMQRRWRTMNEYDPENTEEPPAELFTPPKAKIVIQMINEQYASHRLSRKPVPKEEKEEYIKKCKEYSLWQTHLWRQQRDEFSKIQANEVQCYKAAAYLPTTLMAEVVDVEEKFLIPNKQYKENMEDVEFIEYTNSYLYTPQFLRIVPDEIHAVMKTIINQSVYEEIKSSKGAGEGEEEGEVQVDEEQRREKAEI